MIDKVHMNATLPLPVQPDYLASQLWRHHRYTHGQSRVELYVQTYCGLRLFYAPASRRLTIRGRLVSACLLADHITNLDALDAGLAELRVTQSHRLVNSQRVVDYGLENISQNLDELILDLNQFLTTSVGQPVDISSFQVTYLEACFNTYTDHVNEYIRMFNRIFESRQMSKYKNYVIEHKAPSYSSFYLRGRAQFDKRIKLGYTVNFYNKADWLQNQFKPEHEALAKRDAKWLELKDQGYSFEEAIAEIQPSPLYKQTMPFTKSDYEKSARNLRMEVQLGYRALHDQFGNDRPFHRFITLEGCLALVIKRYEFFIGPIDVGFHSYAHAKSIVEQSDRISNRIRRNLLDYLLRLQQGLNHQRNGSASYDKHLQLLGIHWCLIPKSFDVSFLEPPGALLNCAVDEVRCQKASYARQVEIHKLETSYYYTIEE